MKAHCVEMILMTALLIHVWMEEVVLTRWTDSPVLVLMGTRETLVEQVRDISTCFISNSHWYDQQQQHNPLLPLLGVAKNTALLNLNMVLNHSCFYCLQIQTTVPQIHVPRQVPVSTRWMTTYVSVLVGTQVLHVLMILMIAILTRVYTVLVQILERATSHVIVTEDMKV